MKIMHSSLNLGTKLATYSVVLDTTNFRGYMLANKPSATFEFTGACIDMSTVRDCKLDDTTGGGGDFAHWLETIADDKRFHVIEVTEYEDAMSLNITPVQGFRIESFEVGSTQMTFTPNKELYIKANVIDPDNIKRTYAGKATAPIPADAVKWCRENAPDAIKDLPDAELWEYMEESYKAFAKPSNPNKSYRESVRKDIIDTPYTAELCFNRGSEVSLHILKGNDVINTISAHVEEEHTGWDHEVNVNNRGLSKRIRTSYDGEIIAIEFWVTVAKTDSAAQEGLPNMEDDDRFEHFSFWCNINPDTMQIIDLNYADFDDHGCETRETRRYFDAENNCFAME